MRHAGTSLVALVLTSSVFSALWGVPYIFSFLGMAALVLGGHIVTLDDDIPVLGLLALVPGVPALGR